MRHFFTSESVTEGHPDKMCDQISDSVLDAIIAQDKNARVACECSTNTGIVLVTGEISTNCYVDINKIARNTIKDIGYTNANYGFDANSCGILVSIDEQSEDIALGVDNSLEAKALGKDKETGAGDQGIMFGFASNETPQFMPAAIQYAHTITKRLTAVRKDNTLSYLRPDGKSQVTIEYDNDKILRVDTVVVSAQHDPDIDIEQLREDIKKEVILKALPEEYIDEKMKIMINPTGRFVTGGPQGDSGLTGRKIIVDTYGGYARHGGGCFSGKDPTKVDRSAAYMARFIAKNIVACGLAQKCEIELAYAIGVARPVSIYLNTYGTGKYDDEKLSNTVNEKFDLRPDAIIERLDLLRPIYRQTAAYGHFGRDDIDLSWEKTEDIF